MALSRPTIESVSRASSPSDVVPRCLMSFTHFIHLSSRFSLEFHWNCKSSVSFATPAVLPKRSRSLPNAIIPFLSATPCFTISFARPDVVAASILQRAFTPAALSRCCGSVPCVMQVQPWSARSRLDRLTRAEEDCHRIPLCALVCST